MKAKLHSQILNISIDYRPNLRRQTSTTSTNMLKNSAILAVTYVLKNLSTKLGFVSVNGFKETYFVDELRNFDVTFILYSRAELILLKLQFRRC